LVVLNVNYRKNFIFGIDNKFLRKSLATSKKSQKYENEEMFKQAHFLLKFRSYY